MRILHTSDWHLGRTWDGRSRSGELQAFLDWLLEELERRKVDVLIVAGDVFDTSTPSTEAQSMYYGFLTRISAQNREVVITAGNHDSPSFLDAPKNLLRFLNVHVVGTASVDEELIVFRDGESETPKLVVAAVPFLRARDIRLAMEGENSEEIANREVAGIRRHYETVCRAAEEIRQRYPGHEIPLIATGHLWTKEIGDPGDVRDIHVGTLGQLDSGIFPESIDYLALGHIHRPTSVGQKKTFRYSGSPISMNIDEIRYKKVVVQVDFEGRTPKIEKIPVPQFSVIRRIEGDLPTILEQLRSLQAETGQDTFVEVIYTGSEPVHDLVRQIQESVTRENFEIVGIKNRRENTVPALRAEVGVKLEDLKPIDVFRQLLEEHENAGTDYDPDFRNDMIRACKEILEQCEQAT